MTRPSASTALRALGLLCVLALMAMGRDPFGGGRGGARVVRGPAAGADAGWTRMLAAAHAPAAVIREGARPPDARELAALAALGDRAPVALELPPDAATAPSLTPAGPMAAGRRAALALTVAGPAGSAMTVRLEDDTGAADTLSVAIDSAGRGIATLAVRPASPGWRTWTLAAGGRRASAAAWVEGAEPVRAAVLGGVGGWEARYSARSLEEAGASVAVRLTLGRGLRVGAGGAALDSADVFVVLPGAALSDGEVGRIAARVREDGAGVLLVGTGEPSLAGALGLPVAARGARDGPIEWSLPAELEPLPARDGVRPLAADAPPGAAIAARAGEGAVLVLRPLGRGRAAWSGLADTWRWRLEAGAVEAHRAYWSALADWLGAGRLAGASHAFVPSPPPVGELGLASTPDGSPARLRLPSGTAGPAGPFVPADTGLYVLVDDAGMVLVGTRAVPIGRAAAAHPFGQAALLAYGSGGAALGRAELTAWLAERDSPRRRSGFLAWLLLAVAAACFLAAWTLRRVRGAP